MTRRTLKKLAAASCLWMAMATAALAAPVNFNFSFTDGTNTITGLIEGLESDGTGQEATRITVTGVLSTYVFGKPLLLLNNFDVAGSVIDPTTLYIWANDTDKFGNFVAEVNLYGPDPAFFQLKEAGTSPGDNIVTQSGAITFTPVSAVPLPAGGLLLLSGLGGVAALKRRKKRAA